MTVIDESIAELALDMASPMIDGLIEFEVISRGELCVIVALGDGNGLFDVLRTKRVGVPEEWEEDYEAIATGKIKMMAETGLNSRVAVLLHPALTSQGDVIWWGGVTRDNIIVACSGVQPYFDEAISQTVLSLILAIIEDKVESSREAAKVAKDFIHHELPLN
jgi:hypothetical protein